MNSIRHGLSILLTTTAALAAAIADSAPMTPADLWSIERPRGLALSPDGSRIAYQVTSWDLDAGSANTDLWLLGTGGGEPVRLTWQPGRDASPAWSADGAYIYFVSSRDGEPPQLHRLPVAGGEAERLSDLPRGVSGFALDRAGARALVASSSSARCGDLACVEEVDAEKEAATTTGQVFDGLLYRHWDSWRGDDRSHVYALSLSGNGEAPTDLTPGDVDSPPVSLGSGHDYVLSPDGSLAAVVANRAEMVARSTDNDVELIDLSSGSRKVVSAGEGSDFGPRFSADGRYLFWMSMARAGYESDRHELVRHEIATGKQIRFAATDPDLSIGDFLPAGSGDSIYFSAQEKGRMNLYRASVAGGEIERLVEGGRVSSFVLDDEKGRLYFSLESAASAPEIHRFDIAGGALAPLTDLNGDLLDRLEIGGVDEMWFEGADGDMVHAWIIEPPASAQPAEGKIPVLYLVHGGPQGAWLDDQHPRWSMQQFAALGYYVVAVNFHGSTGYGQDFTDSINQSWGGKPYVDLLAGLDALPEKLPRADTDRVCAAGGSYGGYMVNWLLGHAGERFRCFISHAGVYDLRSMYGATEELWFPEWDLGGTFWDAPESYEKWSPSTSAGEFDTPTLVIHGQLDFRVPVTQGMQLFTALQRRGVPSRFLYYPDEGHWILTPANAAQWWGEIDRWLDAWIGPGTDDEEN